MTRTLKLHLANIKERLERDGKLIGATVAKTTGVITAFRERCRGEYVEFLRTLDYDLRKTLKPLVPSAVIEDNVQYPPISDSAHSSLNSSQRLPEIVGESTTDRLNSHIELLVASLETTAKDLIQILAETNRKYFEMVSPNGIGSKLPTPLAAPLPEYFRFQPDSSQDLDSYRITEVPELRAKLEKLTKAGDITQKQFQALDKQLNDSGYLHSLFDDSDVPVTKREEIVFKLIHSGLIKVPSQKKPHKNAPKPSKTFDAGRGLSDKLKPRTKAFSPDEGRRPVCSTPTATVLKKKTRDSSLNRRLQVKKASQFKHSKSSKKRSELKVRSITPGVTESRRSCLNSKTPVVRRHAQIKY